MAEALAEGTVVAGYRLDGILGEGGMGVVYEATQLSLDRKVALKIVAPSLTADLGFRARFRREGLIQARVEHPNIVTVYEAGEVDGLLFLAMRLVRGSSLKELIRDEDLDPARSLRILRAVGDALDSAHDAGLIHRDVKPHNILVGVRDYPYLADFGITKAVNDTGLTRTGQFLGSLDYIAPEQIRGESATPASDIYALAAVMYECLTGIVPFQKDSEAAVLYAHVAEEPPSATRRRPELPKQLDDVIARGMAKEPQDRPATAAELVEDAESCFGGSTAARINAQPPLQEPAPVSIRPAPTRADAAPEHNATALEDLSAETHTEPDTLEENPPAAVPRAEKGRSPQPPRDLGETGADPSLGGTAADPGLGGTATDPELGETVADHDLRPGERQAGRTQADPGLDQTAVEPELDETIAEPAHPAPRPDRKDLERPRPGKGRRLLIALGVGALVAAVAGYLVGHGNHASANSTHHTMTAGVASFQLTAEWRPTATPSIPGLTLTQSSASKNHAGTVLAAGLMPGASGRTLLPPSFLRRLPDEPSTGDPVKVGEASAYRYTNLTVQGLSQPVTVLAAPTTAGVLGILCLPGTAAASAPCERAADTLKLNGAKPLPLGPSSEYAQALSSAVSKLGPAHGAETELASAHTRGGQAHLAEQLAGDFRSSQHALSQARPGPDASEDNARLLRALSSAAAAYTAMSHAARSGNSQQFSAAGSQASKAQSEIRSSLSSLRAAGYK